MRRRRVLQPLRLGLQHKWQKRVHRLLHAHSIPSDHGVYPLGVIPAPSAARFRRIAAQLHEEAADQAVMRVRRLVGGGHLLPADVVHGPARRAVLQRQVRVRHAVAAVVVIGVVAVDEPPAEVGGVVLGRRRVGRALYREEPAHVRGARGQRVEAEQMFNS